MIADVDFDRPMPNTKTLLQITKLPNIFASDSWDSIIITPIIIKTNPHIDEMYRRAFISNFRNSF